MTNHQQIIAEAVYNAIKKKADALNFVDKMVLMNALKNGHSFAKLPPAQQRLFLDAGTEIIRAIHSATEKEAG